MATSALDNFARFYQQAYDTQVNNAQRTAQLVLQREEADRRERLSRDQLALTAEQVRSVVQSNADRLELIRRNVVIAEASEKRAQQLFDYAESLGLNKALVQSNYDALERASTAQERAEAVSELDLLLYQTKAARDLASNGDIVGAQRVADDFGLGVSFERDTSGRTLMFSRDSTGKNTQGISVLPAPGFGGAEKPAPPGGTTLVPIPTPAGTPIPAANTAAPETPAAVVEARALPALPPQTSTTKLMTPAEEAQSRVLSGLGAFNELQRKMDSFTPSTPSADLNGLYQTQRTIAGGVETALDFLEKERKKALRGSPEDQQLSEFLNTQKRPKLLTLDELAARVYRPPTNDLGLSSLYAP